MRPIVFGAILLLIMASSSSSPTLGPIQSRMTEADGPEPFFQCGAKLPAQGETPAGCTVFTVSKGDQVFFGGNDDYINPDSYYWVDPGGAQGYGAIWIGKPDDVQQGVNERGLAYDADGLPRVDVNPHLEREPVSGGYSSCPIQILHECATVEEVIAWVNRHRWHSYMHDQMQFADATGDAVIISAGADGELVFTRKPRGDGFLVSTNFNVANPNNGYGYPCQRYQMAQDRLGRLVNRTGKLKALDATNVLDAVHVEGRASWTVESLVADLPNGIVYLYYFHQFDRPVVLNVAEEIAAGRAGGPLSKLFAEEVQREAGQRYQRIQREGDEWQLLGKVWLGLVAACLVVLLLGSTKGRKGLLLWLPVVVVLGPLGLLTWLAAGRECKAGNWRASLVEAAADVTPTVVAFILALAAILLSPAAQASQALQFLFFFGLPLLIGWLGFQGPLLAFATRKGYFRTLLQRMPHTWVAADLGMAGIFALALPGATRSAQMPLPPWTVAAWWALAVIGALVAMFLLLLYEGWCVRRGYRAWTVLARGEGKVASAPWRKLSWWVPLSYVALLGGVVGYLFIQQVLPK